jgi:hypothetical protein
LAEGFDAAGKHGLDGIERKRTKRRSNAYDVGFRRAWNFGIILCNGKKFADAAKVSENEQANHVPENTDLGQPIPGAAYFDLGGAVFQARVSRGAE